MILKWTEWIDWPWWISLFFVVGVLATAWAFATMFLALGRRPRRLTIYDRPAAGSARFLESVSGLLNEPLQRGGTVRLLNNGDQIFPAMLDALRNAKRTINFMTYIWHKGKLSDETLDVLVERAKAGVEVRVMLDGMGAWRAPHRRFKELEAAGGRVRWFNPFRVGKLTAFYRRNHRRAVVVDGKVAFTGGASIGDKWLGNAQDRDHWRDVMIEVRGCLAANLQSAFTQLWANSTGEILIGPDHFPSAEEAAEDPGAEGVSRHIAVISSPADGSHPLRLFYWTSIACATETIYLTSAYFVPDRDIRRALAERARAGLDVRLLLPNKLTDVKIVRLAGHFYYRGLLEAGVRIYEYQTTMMHTKALVVDNAWGVVGSANMDIRSKELNQEAVLGIADKGFARELTDTFFADLAQSREIRLHEWKQRPILARALERIVVLFEEQY
ncbi:MAG TPA: phospholipase D-like domain-containing protein [Longimicrobium sp.]